MRTSPPLPVVLCLTALIDGLFEAVCARYGVFPIRGPLVRFLWKRLSRIKTLFAHLAARFAAGDDLSPRPSGPRSSRRKRDAAAFRLTRWVNPKFGWLCRIASGSIGASAYAYALREMMTTDPDMLALLAATPAAARILRPLCRMLGVAERPVPILAATAPGTPSREAPQGDDAASPEAIAMIPRATVASPPPDPSDIVVVFPDPVLKAA